MLSLEPATITGRFYPELFQGRREAAFGKPIVDGQHPHNFFMELAALYDRRLGSHVVATLSCGPGWRSIALGPEAFPHRASIGDDPLAALGHHLEDSTHIADDVVTGGLSWGLGQQGIRVEASGFFMAANRERTVGLSNRGAVDSWSTLDFGRARRLDWVAQYSVGHLHSPEAAHAGEDVLRQTASVAYHHAAGPAEVNAIAVWGRNHTVGSSIDANGYLLETAVRIKERQTIWTRIENADRTTDLLGASAPAMESVVGRVQAYTGGYAHRAWGWKDGTAELGAQVSGYGVPVSLIPLYGKHPIGVAGVFEVRLGEGER